MFPGSDKTTPSATGRQVLPQIGANPFALFLTVEGNPLGLLLTVERKPLAQTSRRREEPPTRGGANPTSLRPRAGGAARKVA